jgi:hypothetical protein
MRGTFSAAAIACALALASPARAATVTIVNGDGPGEGFNDATPATPVGGNPGATVGAQRLYVFQYAASIWGNLLTSSVEIRVKARFDPLFCTQTAAVLGQAGPTAMWRDFPGAPLSGHWYPAALANRLAGSDQSSADDIDATFNSDLGGASCMPSGWYYGVDGNEGGKIELLPVVLHELAHGLGFITATDGSDGSFALGYPSVFDHYLFDTSAGRHWDQMTATERAASAVACRRLVWDGANVIREAPAVLNDKPALRVNAPSSVAGVYDVGVAVFGPALTATGLTANVVQFNDGFGSPSNACEPAINATALSGKIALVDRGTCGFTVKVKNAQNAGAIAVIVCDSLPGCPPQGMGGTDATITIPSVRVTQDDGNLLKSALASGLNVTLRRDPTLNQGAAGGTQVLMYSPTTYSSGSSVSHWDVSPDPDLLMEPSLMGGVSSNVDLTRWFFADLGWTGTPADVTPTPPAPTAPTIALAAAPNPMRSQGLVRFVLARSGWVTLEVLDASGRVVARLADGEPRPAGLNEIAYEPGALHNGLYFLRLRTAAGEAIGKVAIAR